MALVVLGSPTAHATPAPPVPVPEADGEAPSLVPIPVGCPVPTPADVAFVGTVLDKDGFIEKGTVRFQIDQIRSGSAGGFSVNGMIDVRFGPDSQYLDVDAQYLVSAGVDPDVGVLSSKVTPEAPLFGGDAVIGLEDTEVECPVVDDPIQTINVDGTPVETGLFQNFFADRRLLLATVAVPAAVVGVVLVGLVLLRRVLSVGFRGIFALGRAAVTPSPDHAAARVRRHAQPMEADHSDWNEIEVADGDADELVDA